MQRYAAILVAVLLLLPPSAHAMGDDDPRVTTFALHELETVGHPGILAWDAELSVGHDLQRVLLTLSGELAHGSTEGNEAQLLYQHAVSAYWDIHAGWRGDLRPNPERHWLAAGISGTAPGFIETDISLYLGAADRSNLTIELARELLLTQKLHLVPDLEINLYGADDDATGIRSGLADAEFGLRLFYVVHPRFKPYLGMTRSRLLEDTADLARAAGDNTGSTDFVVGFSATF